MIGRESTLAHQGGEDRRTEPFGDLAQLLFGPGRQDATTGQDQRPLPLGEGIAPRPSHVGQQPASLHTGQVSWAMVLASLSRRPAFEGSLSWRRLAIMARVDEASQTGYRRIAALRRLKRGGARSRKSIAMTYLTPLPATAACGRARG